MFFKFIISVQRYCGKIKNKNKKTEQMSFIIVIQHILSERYAIFPYNNNNEIRTTINIILISCSKKTKQNKIMVLYYSMHNTSP